MMEIRVILTTNVYEKIGTIAPKQTAQIKLGCQGRHGRRAASFETQN